MTSSDLLKNTLHDKIWSQKPSTKNYSEIASINKDANQIYGKHVSYA